MHQVDAATHHHLQKVAKKGSCNPDEPILFTQQSAIFQQKQAVMQQAVGGHAGTHGAASAAQSKLAEYARDEPQRSPFGASQGPNELSEKSSKY
jgi:hypothetical protein